jgi:Flp pilus assembly protein TadD
MQGRFEVSQVSKARPGAPGQSEEAFAEQKRALELDPQDADSWNNLGAMLARGGQNAAARAAFEHALQIQPDHAQAKANLARLVRSD